MNKDFINAKLALLKKDNQKTFADLAEPLAKMLEKGEAKKVVKIEPYDSWFTLSFDAVELEKDRLVISAQRNMDGLKPDGNYQVSFEGTRTAYLYGFYVPRHRAFGKPYITWDIRAYANHPNHPDARVHVHGFRAHNELKRLIKTMETKHHTSNVSNKYIKDNLQRFQIGVKLGKDPVDIEKNWSRGLMESLGYNYVEALDIGAPKGAWNDVEVHWCKKKSDCVTV
jgi:hypothetical protein